ALHRHDAEHPDGKGSAPLGKLLHMPAARPSRQQPRAQAVRQQIEQILGSPDFDAARRSRDFLSFIVEETLAGRGDALTQGSIATRVFERKDDFDALLDPIVRIQAGRLRRSLERYYLLAGKDDAIRVELAKGTYVPTFRKVTVGEPVATPVEPQALPSSASSEPAPARAGGWPTLAVVRFEVAVPAPDLLDLTVLLEDKLTAELGRYHDVRVTVRSDASEAAPPSGPAARFELLGRVRPKEEGFSVTARLLDRTTGEQLWGDEYETVAKPERWSANASDVGHVIAARVAAENGVIAQALTGEYRRSTHAVGDPYAAILNSYHFFFNRDPQDFAPAVSALQAAVAREPEVGLAWTQLARVYQVNYVFEISDMATPIDEAIAYAYQGVRLHPLSARTRCVLASALLAKGELQAGRDTLDEALRLNPGSLVYLEIIGYLLALLGDWERGIALVRRAMQLNPHHLPHVSVALWADHLRRGELEPAYQVALEYRDPAFFWRSLMRACSLGHLGRTDEAHAQVAELLCEKPDFAARGRFLIGCFIKPDDLQDSVVAGLHKAGLTLA
ncbi:MAG TPA: hypothetical protein VMV21_21195, partial [Vicinamibacteria bacterium]|nr:hypothetical protein [Vicinamibacteria bacterium]